MVGYVENWRGQRQRLAQSANLVGFEDAISMSDGSAGNGGEAARGRPIKGRRVLENLPLKSRTTGVQAAARSRLVRRLRIALPVFALVLVAAFFFNTRNPGVDQAFLKEFEDISASTDELRMANPRFTGVDENGRPFLITANAATQAAENKNLVALEKPRAVQGDPDETSVVTADKGLFQRDVNILQLSDGVMLEHEIGNNVYVFRSPAATVDIKDEMVSSDAGVGGDGPGGGALKADSMKAYNAEGRIVFEGNVSMRIYPNSVDAETDEIEAPELKDVEINEPQ